MGKRIATGLDRIYYTLEERQKPKLLGELIAFDVSTNFDYEELDTGKSGDKIILGKKNSYDITIQIPILTFEARKDLFGNNVNINGSIRLNSIQRPKVNFYLIQNFADGTQDFIYLWEFVTLSVTQGGQTKNESVNFQPVEIKLTNTKSDCIDIYSEEDSENFVKPKFDEAEEFYLLDDNANPTYRRDISIYK